MFLVVGKSHTRHNSICALPTLKIATYDFHSRMALFVIRNRRFPCASGLAADCQFYAGLFLLSETEPVPYMFIPAASDCV